MSEGATSQNAAAFGAIEAIEAIGTVDRGSGASAETPVLRRSGRRREDRIVVASGAAQRSIDRAILAARSTQPVLVTGAPGTGKSMLARAIHAWSADAAAPLETLACAAVPEPLQARELFGCTAGTYPALPGAHLGALERAAAGTLLLEGLDALAAGVRTALGRALAQGSFRPEGASEELALRTRVIATTDRDLGELPLGTPHQAVDLPPLAERREDVLPLAAHFLAQASAEAGVPAVGFTAEARTALLAEAWPGNVAELRERVRQAVRLTGGGAIPAEALMLAAPSEHVPSFREAKRAFEARYVETVLRLCDGNISQAARLARKDRKDFYDVIRRTGIDPAQFRR
ncbi:MAG: sigma 54-interacting transcriptional regulator [Deltaproteobacteria bacterium]|nr:sigma 54-interacting transcriptional regulator [Deltaproteobacteria bacterium]